VPVAVFLAAVAYLPILGAVDAPRWIVVEVGSFALLLTAPRGRLTPEHVAGGLFLAYAAASILWSPSPFDGVGAVIRLLALAAAFCAAASRTENLDAAWTALGVGASISGLIAAAQVVGAPIFHMPGFDPTAPIGLFGNKNFMAGFGALAFVATVLSRPTWLKPPLLAGTALAAFLPLSMGAILGIAVGLAFARLRPTAFWLALAGLLAAALGADLWLFPDRIVSSLQPRLVLWQLSWANLSWFGWGIGSYGSLFPAAHAFNDALEYVVELGVGAVPLLIMVALALRRGRERTEGAILVAALVESLFAFPLHQPAHAFVAVVCAGFLCGAGGRARVLEPGRRGHRDEGLLDPGHLGVGALHAADLRRQALPV
jgi:hypothetical protein